MLKAGFTKDFHKFRPTPLDLLRLRMKPEDPIEFMCKHCGHCLGLKNPVHQ